MPFVHGRHKDGVQEAETAKLFPFINMALFKFVPQTRAPDEIAIEKYTLDNETSEVAGRYWFRIRNRTKGTVVKECGPFKIKSFRQLEIELMGTENGKRIRIANLDKPLPVKKRQATEKKESYASSRAIGPKTKVRPNHLCSFPDEFREGAKVLPDENGFFRYGDMVLETKHRYLTSPKGKFTVPIHFHQVLMFLCTRPRTVVPHLDLIKAMGTEVNESSVKAAQVKMARMRKFTLRIGLQVIVLNKNRQGYYLTDSVRNGL